MTIASPFAALALLLILPILALYLSKRRAKVFVVPAAQHWEWVGEAVRPSMLARLLRNWPSLLAQCLILLLLVVAMCKPIVKAASAPQVVIILDASVSLQTKEADGRPRFELAKDAAQTFVKTLKADTEVTVIEAGRIPRILPGMPTSPRGAALAIAELKPLECDSGLLRAIEIARSSATETNHPDIAIVSDFAGFDDAAIGAMARARDTQLIAVGTNRPNCALRDITLADGETSVLLRFRLVQRGLDGAKRTVVVSARAQEIATQVFTLDRASIECEIALPQKFDSLLKLSIVESDSLDADNTAFVNASAFSPISVALWGVQQPSVKSAVMASRRLAIASDSTPADVVIASGREALPSRYRARPILFINTADPFGLTSAGPAVNLDRVTSFNADHPVLKSLDPTTLHGLSVVPLKSNDHGSFHAIASVDTIPVLAEGRPFATSPQLLFWTFRLDDAFTRTVPFAILLWDSIDFLADDVKEGVASCGCGESATIPRDPADAMITAADESGQPISVSAAGNQWSVGPIARPGIVTLSGSKRPCRVAASVQTSRTTAPLPTIPAPHADNAKPTGLFSFLSHWTWRHFVLLAVAVALAEWILYQLRWLRVA